MANIFNRLGSLFADDQVKGSGPKALTAQKPSASSTDSQNNQQNLWENIGDSVKDGFESVVSVVSGKSFQSSSQSPSQSQTQSQIGLNVGDKRKAENLFSPDNSSKPPKRSRWQDGAEDGVERAKQAAQRAREEVKQVSKMLQGRSSQDPVSQRTEGSSYNNNHLLSPSPVQRVNQASVASTGSQPTSILKSPSSLSSNTPPKKTVLFTEGTKPPSVNSRVYGKAMKVASQMVTNSNAMTGANGQRSSGHAPSGRQNPGRSR